MGSGHDRWRRSVGHAGDVFPGAVLDPEAISNASSGSWVGMRFMVRQPTKRREKTSMTNAVNANPRPGRHVGEVDHPVGARTVNGAGLRQDGMAVLAQGGA